MRKDRSEVSIWVKYSLFFLNVLFWVIGVVTLGVGIYAKTVKELNTITANALPWFMDPAILFIIFGSVVFILAFTGCVGALRENTCLLKVYEYAIDIIMILEIAIGIYVYVDRDRVKATAKNALKKTIPQYRDDADLQNIMDYFQETVKCCGINSYEDWEENVYFNCSSKGTEACGVPYSCCIDFKKEMNTQCGFGVRDSKVSMAEREKKIYIIGCVDATLQYLTSRNNLIIVLCVTGFLIFIQLLSTGLAHSLINGIRMQKAKWQRPGPPRGYDGHQNPGYR